MIENRTEKTTRRKFLTLFAAHLGLAALPLVCGLCGGCSREPENLASQIGPITATLGPNVDGEGRPIQEVRYTFKNNGPKAVGAVFAKTDVYDAAGNLTGDSTERYCIFGSTSPADRLKPGQTYQTAAGHGYLLSGPAARVVAVPLDATQKGDAEFITEGASESK